MRTAPAKNTVVERKRPARLDNPAQFLADDFDDEDIQSAVDELAPMCDDFRQRSFRWYYDVGTVVHDHYEPLRKQRSSMYGQRFFNRLARDLNRPHVSGPLLSKCFRLVKAYTAKQYMKLSRYAAVSPTHVLMLAGIEDRQCRDKLTQQVISEHLTTAQLERAIKDALGFRREPGAGRPPKRPKKLKDAFVHLTAQVDKFTNLNDVVWFGKEYDIVRELQELPAGKLTDELKTQVSDAARKCDQLAATATKDAQALRGLLPEINRRMQAQAQLEANLEAESRQDQEVHAELKAKPANAPRRARRAADREIGRARRAV